MEKEKPVDLLSAVSIVAASMIGAGVFTTSGFALGSLESPALVVLAWCVGGVIAVCGAICYGGLADRFTESGGEYLFLSKAVHPVAGMMAGWVSLLAGFTGALAFAAATFAEYLAPTLGLAAKIDGVYPLSRVLVACGLVAIAALVHSFRVKPGARFQDAIVVLKFLLIGGFVFFAAYKILNHIGDWHLPADTPNSDSAADNDAPAKPWLGIRFATQLVWISLSYSGFQAAVYVTGEVKDAKKNVPRAMFWGTVVVTLVYVVLNAIFVYGTPASKIVFQEQVATLSAESIGGSGFESFTRGLILICLATSASALTITGPRVYCKMAEDGFLPRKLRLSEGRAPVFSIWLQASLAMVVLAVSTLPGLLSYLGFTLSISAALTACLLLVDSARKTRVPFYPLPLIVFVGGTLLTATLSAIDRPVQAIVAVATICFGGLMYPIYNLKRKSSSISGNDSAARND